MATRKAISVNDDNGFYSLALGARPIPWARMRTSLEESYAYEERAEFDVERLMGWDPWTYAILVNGQAVAFVDGEDEPTDLPYTPREMASR